MVKGHNGRATETPDASHISNPDVTHEVSDVNVVAVLKFGAGLTILTVVVYVLMLLLFNRLNAREISKEAHPGPMALSERERLPPEPRLQAAPGFAEDLARSAGEREVDPKDPLWEIRVLRERWNDALKNGRRDSNGKIVGMPIDQAMQKVLEENKLAARAQPNSAANLSDYEISMPTAASSGRLTEKRQ